MVCFFVHVCFFFLICDKKKGDGNHWYCCLFWLLLVLLGCCVFRRVCFYVSHGFPIAAMFCSLLLFSVLERVPTTIGCSIFHVVILSVYQSCDVLCCLFFCSYFSYVPIIGHFPAPSGNHGRNREGRLRRGICAQNGKYTVMNNNLYELGVDFHWFCPPNLYMSPTNSKPHCAKPGANDDSHWWGTHWYVDRTHSKYQNWPRFEITPKSRTG